jgi:tubulin polyglutamylase TTLL6/13
MSSIFREVEERGFDLISLKHRIDEIIRLTITSIQPFLSNNYKAMVSVNDGKSRCFELLGFDILLDNQAHPWLLEVNFMPMLDVDTKFDGELKSAVLKGIFTILGLSPTFKRQVMKRQKAETEKRINGVTLLPMNQIFDPAIESKAAAERTDWRQLYPLLENDSSDIETALSQVKTITMASIENGAFRARQRAVLSQLQEIRERETVGQWKPTQMKFYVQPAIPPIKKEARSPSPERSRPIVVQSQPPVVLENPHQPISRPPVPPQKIAELAPDVPLFVHFSAMPPQFILAEEESVRQAALAKQSAEAAFAGIDRIVCDFFHVVHRPNLPGRHTHSLLKLRQSVVAKPIVKMPIPVHHHFV